MPTMISLSSPYYGSFHGTLTFDQEGDIFGESEAGGATGSGAVFELVKADTGYGAPTTLVSFNGANGAYPYGGLTIDASGDLFGTTEELSHIHI